MKIRKITREKLDTPIPVYDIRMATPFNNFLCKGKTGNFALHNCGFLDEMNFSKDADASEGLAASGLMKLYNAVKSRMKSRFLKAGGELPGILFMVSSKRSEYDFLEEYVRQQKGDPNTYIVDDPVWNIKPKSTYCGERFKVAVGNRYVKSRILTENEDTEAVLKQGYDQIIDVPVEYRREFEMDIDSSLMDIANIASSAKSKFIAFDRLERNYSRRPSPFRSEILRIGLDDQMEIEHFLNLTMIDEYTRKLPGFMHLDTSIKGDRTGISYSCISGVKNVQKYIRTESGATIKNAVDAVIRQVFTVGIEAPSGSEISFEKTRKFIYFLRDRGFNIKGISVDGFQSADTIQLLTKAGFNIKLVSLDRKPDGYLAFKAAIAEERIDLLNIRKTVLEREIVELERDSVSGKIDHPPAGCFVADTLLWTSNGKKRIIDLTPDDKIKAYDVIKQKAVVTDFRNLRRTRYEKELLQIFFCGRSCTCTYEHPFYVVDTKIGIASYVKAEDLNPLVHLLRTDEGTVEIEKVEKVSLPKAVPVYDIEVPTYSNFALASGVIVHNSKDLSDSLCGSVWLAMSSDSAVVAVNTEDDVKAATDLIAESSESPLTGMFDEELKNIASIDNQRIDDFTKGTPNFGSSYEPDSLDADDIIF